MLHQAEAIRGLRIEHDPEGDRARMLGAETSGDLLFYDATGALRFHGGLTAARGHKGPSAARDCARVWCSSSALWPRVAAPHQ